MSFGRPGEVDRAHVRFDPASMVERDADPLVDRHRVDVQTGREGNERWIVRGGQVRTTPYLVRL